MAKQKKENNNLNQIKPLTNVIFNIIFLVLGDSPVLHRLCSYSLFPLRKKAHW